MAVADGSHRLVDVGRGLGVEARRSGGRDGGMEKSNVICSVADGAATWCQ